MRSSGAPSSGPLKADEPIQLRGDRAGRGGVTAPALAGRVAVVTGALGRLGPVWCEALLEAGATVVGLDLAGTPVSPAFSNLQAESRQAAALLRTDVRDREALVSARTQCEAEAGAVDVLVNNAGIDQPPGPATTYRLEDIPARSLRPGAGGQCHRRIPGDPGLRSRDGLAGARLHHQHRVALRLRVTGRPLLRAPSGRPARSSSPRRTAPRRPRW